MKLLEVNINGNLIEAQNCELDKVRQSITLANYGDTVKVPAGECEWNETLQITKGIRLYGTGIDATIIRSKGKK